MEIKLHYTQRGEGAPLILLHGNGEDGSYFAAQLEHFSARYRVIAVDTRGHGKSPRGASPFTIRQFADDLLNFMDELGIEKAHILGFSDGGNIAMIFAIKYPGRVDRLILNGANLNGRGVKPTVQLPIILGYKLASHLARKDPKARQKAELLGLMVNEPSVEPAELAKISAPTLVIAGTRDMIKDSHTRLIHASISNARLAIIPGDHFIAAKAPDEFNRAVDDFLNI